MLVVDLSPEAEKQLEEIAISTGRTEEFHVRKAILNYLEDSKIKISQMTHLKSSTALAVRRIRLN